MKALWILFVVGLWPLVGSASQFKEPSAEEVAAASKTFQFRGQWIHPKIIKEFVPWDSDHSVPLIHSVDVGAATGTNRFFGAISFDDQKKSVPAYASSEGEKISYEWQGRLANGMHVLVVRESGGGTMVATSLLVFSLNEGAGVLESGKKYRQLLLQIERYLNLGDRGLPHVSIRGNQIHVKTEFNGARKTEEKTISL